MYMYGCACLSVRVNVCHCMHTVHAHECTIRLNFLARTVYVMFSHG